MRVVIDLQGVQTEALPHEHPAWPFVMAMARSQGPHELLLCLCGYFPDSIEPIRALLDGVLLQENIRVWHAPVPVRAADAANASRRRATALIRRAFLASLKPDIVVLTGLFDGFDCDAVSETGAPTSDIPSAVLLDHVLPLQAPDILLKPYPEYERFVLERAQSMRRALLCFALMPGVADAVRKFFGTETPQVVDLTPTQTDWDWSATVALGELRRICPVPRGDPAGESADHLIAAVAETVPANASDADIAALADALGRIGVQGRPRRIFVDVSELVRCDACTGVQRVTRSILQELLRHPPGGFTVHAVFALPNSRGYRYAAQFTAQFMNRDTEEEDEVIVWRAGDIFLGLDLQRTTTIIQAERLCAMRRDGVGVFFVVYDLLPIQFPHYWPPQHDVAGVHGKWLSIISRFDGALCISRSVAKDLGAWCREHAPARSRPFRIGWFSLGADMAGSVPTRGLPDTAEKTLQILRQRPSFLCVGTIEPRKGQAQALAAFELLWAQGVDANLVLVGRKGWLVDDLVARIKSHGERGKRLFWLDGISDEYLEKVYTAATCLLAPSEGEGFGLPLIEGAQHGLPILARDIPVFREVAGAHAQYFSGLGGGDLAVAMHHWLKLHRQGRVPDSRGLPWLTWNQSAAVLTRALFALRR